MKILHAITSLDKGGAENHLSILTKEQIKNGNNISIFISKNSFYWVKILKKYGIKVYKSNYFIEKNLFFKFFKLYKDIICITKLINEFKPHILHAHLPYMEIVCYVSLYLTKYKPKFIISKHLDNVFFKNSEGQKKSLAGSFIARKISNKACKIIAISKAVKKFLISDFVGIQKNRIRIVRYGIDDAKTLSRKEKNIKLKKIKFLNKKNLILGSIARLVPQKSIDNILISLSLNKDKNIKLIIVGDGPLKLNLKKLAIKLNVNKQIIWIDFVDDLIAFYKNIDVFVLTSQYEGLGLVFLEAMLSKKPIICSNTSAMPEIVENNFNGFLIKPDRPVELSDAISKLKNKKLRFKLGSNGYKKVKQEFSVKKMYLETNRIYNL